LTLYYFDFYFMTDVCYAWPSGSKSIDRHAVRILDKQYFRPVAGNAKVMKRDSGD